MYVGALPLLLKSAKASEARHLDGDNLSLVSTVTALRIGRGGNALSLSKTPALKGAERGTVKCDVNVDSLAYWNSPQGLRDRLFQSPFAGKERDGKPRYLTFEPDRGGWNNLRMSFENVVVIAAATGRTLVLPPDQPLYLLQNDPQHVERNFGDFFNLYTPEFSSRITVITTEEFISREGSKDGRFTIPDSMKDGVANAQKKCQHRKKSDIACMFVYDYLKEISFSPSIHGEQSCLIFDEGRLNSKPMDQQKLDDDRVKKFCQVRSQLVMVVSYTFTILKFCLLVSLTFLSSRQLRDGGPFTMTKSSAMPRSFTYEHLREDSASSAISMRLYCSLIRCTITSSSGSSVTTFITTMRSFAPLAKSLTPCNGRGYPGVLSGMRKVLGGFRQCTYAEAISSGRTLDYQRKNGRRTRGTSGARTKYCTLHRTKRIGRSLSRLRLITT